MSFGSPNGFGNGFGSRGFGYGSGYGSRGFNTTGSGGNTGSGWQSTATTLLPWLAFLYGVYQDRNRDDGGFQAVPQTPEQRALYERLMKQFEGMQANNQAAFNLALPGAMSAPGKLDIAALQRGEVGYTGRQAPNPADLQRILQGQQQPPPTGTPTGTPSGTPSTPGTPQPSTGPGTPPNPTGAQPGPSQPQQQTPIPIILRDDDFAEWLRNNGGADVLAAMSRASIGQGASPTDRALIMEWWNRYQASKGKP